jgi:predicted nucleotidyltransferase
MLQKYSKYRILQEFFNFPTKNFQMRELSRKANIAHPSTIAHLKALVKEGFVLKETEGIYPSYRANKENELFKVYKKTNLLIRMQESGFIDYVCDSCMPDVLILYGSASRGEDIEISDIDLFAQAPEKKLNLEKYEKLFNRKISIFFEEKFQRLSKELKNNILNGIILRGYIKVF